MFEFAGNSRFFNSRSHCQLEWKHLPDGQFQNVQTGKCLTVREDSSENGIATQGRLKNGALGASCS